MSDDTEPSRRTDWTGARPGPGRPSSGRRRRLIAQGRTNVPILEITQAADVGHGLLLQPLRDQGTALRGRRRGRDRRLRPAARPAHRRTSRTPPRCSRSSFRLTGRLHRREPELSRVLLNNVAPAAQRRQRPGAPRPTRHHRPPSTPADSTSADADVAVAITAGALARPRPATPRPAGPRRRADHRPDDRGPATHVRRTAPPGAPDLLACPYPISRPPRFHDLAVSADALHGPRRARGACTACQRARADSLSLTAIATPGGSRPLRSHPRGVDGIRRHRVSSRALASIAISLLMCSACGSDGLIPLVGPCEVCKEGSQRLEGLGVGIAARANHLCI